MAKRMLIDARHHGETRVVIADDNQIFDFDFISTAKKQLKGNIYLAKITRVEPSLQAAFVEYGGNKQGFLPFSEIHPDYYQIPVSDRRRLMEEAAQAEADDPKDDPKTDNVPVEPAADTAVMNLAPEGTVVAPDGAPAGIAENASAADAENERPAYLSQEAVDISASEHVEPPEGADDTIPFSQALNESEQSADPAQETPVASESGADEQSGEQPAAETQSNEGVETLPNEEEEYRPKKTQFFKRYKIQEVIRRGQIVLVQVIKEERGNKGVSLTTYLSLAGRYCVLMPNSPKDGGISRKIASADDRKRLKAISTELRLAQGMSVIIRTAGMDRTRAEIKRDFDYLVKVWNQIREDTLKSNAPALIYEESEIIKRAIRDQYTGDIDELIIEGDDGYRAAREFMKLLLPSHTPKIKHYKEATPLFYAYNIEEQLLSMHDPVVKLRSGGYIVINPTEALISIDVNSGRATGERNIEETATKTNLEAAAEVARQLRLRDLAGLIVIDFIDMMESRNRRAIEKALKDALKADRAKIQLGRISPFGLLEMSRQRLRPSISETNMVQCPHCVGRGYIRSNESMSIQLIRAIEKEASAGTWSGLRLIVPQEIALHLLNTKRDVLRSIEERHNVTIQVLIDADLASSEFNLEKMRRSQAERQDNERRGGRGRRRDHSEQAANDSVAMPEEAGNDNVEQAEAADETQRDDIPGESERRRGRRRRGGRNRNRDRGRRPYAAGDDTPPGQAVAPEDAPFEEQAAQDEQLPRDGTPDADRGDRKRSGRPPRTRGGRGRRRWRDERGNRKPREDVPPYGSGQDGSTASEHDTDGTNLPAFATEEPVMIEPERPREPEPVKVAANAGESDQRGNDASGKKGWWQKMIELDD